MRLQKYLAGCGVASRRHAEQMIADGLVSVNGQIITEMGVQVEEGDEIRVSGKIVRPEPVKKYIIYHKPAGEVTTASDPEGRRSVLEHFRQYPVRLFTVGRLDYDSEGLLLLTNDGDLAEKMMHPSHEVDKGYLIKITGSINMDEVQKLRRGVMLDERLTSPAKVRVISLGEDFSSLLVTIHEGRNRQVRRMVEQVGHQVVALKRVQFGILNLGDLPRGQWRELSAQEVERLLQSVE